MRRLPGERVIPDKGFRSTVDFPDPRRAMAEGLVAIGGRLDVGTLYHAYSRGIFPWPQPGIPMLWFSPEERGILIFEDVKIPRRWKTILKDRSGLRFSRDEAFRRVVEACRAQPRPGQDGTWILPEMVVAYVQLHDAGFARSYEVWRGDELVGGLYGVFIEGVFSGESMFHHEDDASKRALLFTIEQLRDEGIAWMDTQMVTPVVEAFGGKLIPRDQYLKLMRESQKNWNQPSVRTSAKRK